MKTAKQYGKYNCCGERIRDLREAAGLSQEKLAAKIQLAGLGITQKAVSRIETGIRIVPDYELRYFADALEVSVIDLLDLNAGKPENPLE